MGKCCVYGLNRDIQTPYIFLSFELFVKQICVRLSEIITSVG